jgi:hypothetical protein
VWFVVAEWEYQGIGICASFHRMAQTVILLAAGASHMQARPPTWCTHGVVAGFATILGFDFALGIAVLAFVVYRHVHSPNVKHSENVSLEIPVF